MNNNLLQSLEMLAADLPDKICVRDGTQSLSRKQLMNKWQQSPQSLRFIRTKWLDYWQTIACHGYWWI